MRKIALALISVMMSLVLAVHAQPYHWTLGGASPEGLWSLLGVGIDRAVKAAYPGSTITYQTSGGGIANVQLLDQNKVALGIVHNVELRLAQNGQEPFHAPVKDLRVIASLYNWAPFQLVITRDFADRYGILKFEDIAVKKPPLRVALNRRGNIGYMVVDRMFQAIGVRLSDIEKWGGNVLLAASAEQEDLIKNRRVDAVFNTLFIGHRSLLDIGQSIPVVMLPLEESTIKAVESSTGAESFIIPAKSYPWQPKAVDTLSVGALLMVNKSITDEDAYNLARALVEQIDQLRGVHPSMRALTPEFMARESVGTFHPGAAKYYREKDLLKGPS